MGKEKRLKRIKDERGIKTKIKIRRQKKIYSNQPRTKQKNTNKKTQRIKTRRKKTRHTK